MKADSGGERHTNSGDAPLTLILILVLILKPNEN
jgi:hypothetical protein